MTKVCDACKNGPLDQIKHCHECGGLGYVDTETRECKQEPPDCPIVMDIMTGGWECERCGRGGPG